MGLCAPIRSHLLPYQHQCIFSCIFHGVVTKANGCIRVLLSGDGFVPGNPNRIDKGRELVAYYYTFLDPPTFMLNRCKGWFVFGDLVMRTITKSPPGDKGIMASILKELFVHGVANFTHGF